MKRLKLFALLLATALFFTGMSCVAPLAEDNNLVINGSFEDAIEGWTYSEEDTNNLFSIMDSADGDFHAKPAPNTHLQQIIPVEGHKTYKLSFKLQSTKENAVTFLPQAVYMAEGTSYRNLYGSIEADPDQYRAILAENAFSYAAFGAADTGEAPEWKEYSMLIPVPSMKIDAFRLRLIFGDDPYIALDDIRFEKVKDDAATVINGDFEILKSDNLTVPVGWSNTTGSTFVVEKSGGSNNARYVKDTSGSSVLYQFIPVEENTTYRISLKMKASKKDAAGLNLVSTNLWYKDNVAVKIGMTNPLNFGLADYTGDEAMVWRPYSLELSAPEGVNFLRLAIQNNGDETLGLDDISIEKVSGNANYIMNGDFEAGMAGWQDLGESGAIAAETNGNLYFNRTATDRGKYLRQWNIWLPQGRYQLSFKAKTANRGDKISVNLFGSDGRGKTEELNGWCEDYIAAKTVTSNASFTDDWQTFNFYFTLPADRQDIILALTTAYWGGKDGAVGAMHFDDISIRKDETRLEFASYTQESITNESFSEAKNGEAVTKLQGKESVPVTAHYVPEKDGVAEKVTLCVALYQKGDVKRLVEFDAVSGTTVVSEDTMQGKNAGGILTLATDMEIPDDADESYVLKASLYRGGNLVDVSYKEISIGW